jgi:hypothetical protein
MVKSPHIKSRPAHPRIEDRKLRKARPYRNGPEVDEPIRPVGPFPIYLCKLFSDPSISRALLDVNIIQ